MSEESRLGREAIETAYALKQLVHGRRPRVLLPRGPGAHARHPDRQDHAVADGVRRRTGAREGPAAHVRRHAAEGARRPLSPAGGFSATTTSKSLDASGKRSHVERAINPAEAEVVRRIFELCANGTGYTRIAKQLNADRARPHAAAEARAAWRGWAPSSVKVILDRRLYLGEITWNRTKKTDAWGQKHQRKRPEADWICRPAPELRRSSPMSNGSRHITASPASAPTYSRPAGGGWGRAAGTWTRTTCSRVCSVCGLRRRARCHERHPRQQPRSRIRLYCVPQARHVSLRKRTASANRSYRPCRTQDARWTTCSVRPWSWRSSTAC